MNTKNITKEGVIFREGNVVVVRSLDAKDSLNYGAVCLNPESSEELRIYEKRFKNKRIFLPEQYELFAELCLSTKDAFIITMNGYSYIDEAQCVRYGIQLGQYEAACEALMTKIIRVLREKFDGAYLMVSYGSSDMGVDSAIEKVAESFNLPLLGFSCPKFMLYVKDDHHTVFVAETADAYGDYYIRSSDLLISTGGREHALKHDVLAACIYNKRVHFVDVLNNLSTTGGVPATIKGPGGSIKIDNAAAAFGRNVSFFNRDNAVAHTPSNGDRWDAIFDNVSSVATEVCRGKMSPSRMFKK